MRGAHAARHRVAREQRRAAMPSPICSSGRDSRHGPRRSGVEPQVSRAIPTSATSSSCAPDERRRPAGISPWPWSTPTPSSPDGPRAPPALTLRAEVELARARRPPTPELGESLDTIASDCQASTVGRGPTCCSRRRRRLRGQGMRLARSIGHAARPRSARIRATPRLLLASPPRVPIAQARSTPDDPQPTNHGGAGTDPRALGRRRRSATSVPLCRGARRAGRSRHGTARDRAATAAVMGITPYSRWGWPGAPARRAGQQSRGGGGHYSARLASAGSPARSSPLRGLRPPLPRTRATLRARRPREAAHFLGARRSSTTDSRAAAMAAPRAQLGGASELERPVPRSPREVALCTFNAECKRASERWRWRCGTRRPRWIGEGRARLALGLRAMASGRSSAWCRAPPLGSPRGRALRGRRGPHFDRCSSPRFGPATSSGCAGSRPRSPSQVSPDVCGRSAPPRWPTATRPTARLHRCGARACRAFDPGARPLRPPAAARDPGRTQPGRPAAARAPVDRRR